MHSEMRVLTRTRVLMWVFPARSVPLPPVWHHRISLRLIVHTVPAACSLWTVCERRIKSTETKDCENMLLVLSFTASLWFDLIICATQQKKAYWKDGGLESPMPWLLSWDGGRSDWLSATEHPSEWEPSDDTSYQDTHRNSDMQFTVTWLYLNQYMVKQFQLVRIASHWENTLFFK